MDMSLQRLSGFALFSTMWLWECSEVQVNFRPSRNCGFLLLPLSNFPAFKVNFAKDKRLECANWTECNLRFQFQSNLGMTEKVGCIRWHARIWFFAVPIWNVGWKYFFPQSCGLKPEEKYTNRVLFVHVGASKTCQSVAVSICWPHLFWPHSFGHESSFWKMPK